MTIYELKRKELFEKFPGEHNRKALAQLGFLWSDVDKERYGTVCDADGHVTHVPDEGEHVLKVPIEGVPVPRLEEGEGDAEEGCGGGGGGDDGDAPLHPVLVRESAADGCAES